MGTLERILARLTGQRVYLDANIFIYFLDRSEKYLPVVLPLMQAAFDRHFLAFTGRAAVAEVMVHPYRHGNPEVIARFKQFFASDFLSVVEHSAEQFDTAAMLVGQRKMKLVDALHHAAALHANCHYLLSNDRGFGADGTLEVIGMDAMLAAVTGQGASGDGDALIEFLEREIDPIAKDSPITPEQVEAYVRKHRK